jgi:hypothetical protein
MLDQKLLSTYLVIIAKLAISFYISFYSWDLSNVLLMCVQVMKQGSNVLLMCVQVMKQGSNVLLMCVQVMKQGTIEGS